MPKDLYKRYKKMINARRYYCTSSAVEKGTSFVLVDHKRESTALIPFQHSRVYYVLQFNFKLGIE